LINDLASPFPVG